ncbi:MSHA biogenesis protein MshI [Parashewanella curva]|uniref:MSHA biogenesis protein MshI n=1 Tax=Parashewanella curva TaxID=2338552 RepID=A0A3L8PWQ6_9GAMM|nr:MSHA biogenesis protein MshI [Parashewanella curva]RLV59053.1 MSHA biogenesis protein MshI [Parashewanella curva]
MGNLLSRKLAFWKKPTESTNIGIYIDNAHVWCFTKHEGELDAPKNFARDEGWSSIFTAISTTYPQAQFQIVLGHGCYQLLQVDRPQVDDAELKQALMWSIKDLVSTSVTQLHLDYFSYSISSNNKLNVVVTEKNMLQQMLSAACEQDLTCKGISVEEIALTNTESDTEQARLMLCYQEGAELLLVVIKGGELCLQRRIRGFHALNAMSKDDLSYGAADTLSLEIQRSMDFYESQSRHAPIGKIQLVLGARGDDLKPLLAQNLQQPIESLHIENYSLWLAELALKEFCQAEDTEKVDL